MIKHQYGPTIAFIRLEKKIAQQQLYGQLFSKKEALRFEKGDSDISATHFFLLLQRLSISSEEFFFIQNSQLKTKSLLRQIKEAYLEKNIRKLNSIYSKHIQQTNDYLKTNAIIAHLLYTDLMLEPIDADQVILEKIYLKNFLLKKKRWFIEEIDLFSLYFSCLDIATTQSVMRNCFQSLLKYQDFPEFQSLISKLLTSYIMYCYQHHLINEGNNWLLILSKHSFPESCIVESFYKQFCKVIQQIVYHQKQEAKEEFQRISVMLDLLNLKQLKEQFEKDYLLFTIQFKRR